MKPNFKKPSGDLEKNVKVEFEKIKAELDAKADERVRAILQEREEKTKKERADKIAEAMDAAKKIAESSSSSSSSSSFSSSGTVAIGPEQAKHDHKDDEIACPTCKSHVHKVDDKNGLIYKCTKDGCGFEAIMVDKRSDFKCNNCGAPIKKPEDPTKEKEMEGCPFCKSKKAVRHNWGKLWGVVNK
jgi:Zn finger protein HypA/HybF involved in hydrogenase expression